MNLDVILITGSNGFVGSCFLDFIMNLPKASKPREIILVNRTPAVHPILKVINSDTKITTINQDLSQEWNFEAKGSHVLHLAADGSESAYSIESSETFKKICSNFEKWATRNRPYKIVNGSSGACFYSNVNNPLWFDKKDFIKSRLFGEELVFSLQKYLNLKIVNARLFTFLGPRILKKQHYAASNFIHDAIKTGFINMSGHKDTVRTYMHERTMASWLYRCLTHDSVGGIVSIGSYEAVKLGMLASFISKLTGAQIIYNEVIDAKTSYIPIGKSGLEKLGLSFGPKWYEIVKECIDLVEMDGD